MSAFVNPSRAARRAAACVPCLLLITGVVAAAACSPLTDPKPSTDVVTDTLVAWAINGTGSSEPSAYYLADNDVVTVTSALTFDVAFDVDSASGQAVVIPVRLLTDGSVTAFHVGLQRLTMSFDSTTFGLKNGYQFDSIYTLSPGQGLMIVSNPPGCAADPNPSLYGKFVIDSVNRVTRTIHFRATEDPNCGYRDLAVGIPTF
jgi:hypothetical protein